METKFIDVSNLRVRYLETDGKSDIPLIILHGWGSQANRWVQVMNILEKQESKAIAVDLPGFGESPAPADSWNLDDYCGFVRDFVQTLGIESFYILGHSFGGRIAIKLAAAQATGLVKLILVDAAGITPRHKGRLFTYKVITKIAKPFVVLPILRKFRNTAAKIIYWLSGSYDYYVQTGTMRETFKKVLEEDLTPYLHKIKIPTSIMWGKMDKMTPVSDAYIIHQSIVGSRLTVFESGNHSLHLQMPKKLAREIINFIIA